MTPVDTLKREAEQKAALEAAAPDLLAALKACARILPRYHMAGRTVSDDEEHGYVLESVLEAIAKAEGRS